MTAPFVGTQLGPYRLDAVIAQDRSGTVYRGVVANGETVAVRPISPATPSTPWFQEDVVRALRPYTTIHHPNLLPLIEVATYNGTPVAVTPLPTGDTLRNRLGQPLLLADTLTLLQPLAGALDALHDQRLVHGDLRPANVLLAPSGDLWLANAGIARASDSVTRFGAAANERTVEEVVYLAPEAAQGAPTDTRADLYAFGIILYEALVGRPPFPSDGPGATAASITAQQATMAPPAPRARNPLIAPQVEAVLVRALAKSPYERYPSATALCAALRNAGTEQHEQHDKVPLAREVPQVRPVLVLAPPLPSLTVASADLTAARARLVGTLRALARQRSGQRLTNERQHLVATLQAREQAIFTAAWYDEQPATKQPRRHQTNMDRPLVDQLPSGGQPQSTSTIKFRVTLLAAARWALGKIVPVLLFCALAVPGLVFKGSSWTTACVFMGLAASLTLILAAFVAQAAVTTITCDNVTVAATSGALIPRRRAWCEWHQVRAVRYFETTKEVRGWLGGNETRVVCHLAVDGPRGEVLHQTDEVGDFDFSALIEAVTQRTSHLPYTWVRSWDTSGKRITNERILEQVGNFAKVARH